LTESRRFLTEQIITYIGNKRSLIPFIDKEIIKIKKILGKNKIILGDLFSGSGIVARAVKQHAEILVINDLELYSQIINSCYLSNYTDFDKEKYLYYCNIINEKLSKKDFICGVISKNYAPENEKFIQKDDRVFYTTKNAAIIDTIRNEIDKIDSEYKKYFLAPLLYMASVHNNTAGVFKGFYKDSQTGVGKFGGNGEHALNRIKGEIKIVEPVFSEFICDTLIFRKDANELVKEDFDFDIVYLDPPYNQHPYGSNYFMLNVVAQNCLSPEISKVSGIPSDWNRSNYNKRQYALNAFNDLVNNIKSKFVIISYNSEGFISFDEMMELLRSFGKVSVKKNLYNTYRGSKNLRSRSLYVTEYLFILKKK